MSATLTWASSGNATRSGSTNAAFIDDLDTHITSKSGDASFFWEKAGKSNAGTPRYLLLRRKDGSAGRIAIIIWDSAPAANNVAILGIVGVGAPTINNPQIAWFPAGTGTTLSNLTAASGTICGDDTDCVQCSSPAAISTVYQTGFLIYYFDCAEAMIFAFSNPASAQIYSFAAGNMLVDGADVVYGCTWATTGAASLSSFGSAPVWTWSTSSSDDAGTAVAVIRTNYGSSKRKYYNAFGPSGGWASQAVGPLDVLTDTSLSKIWLAPVQLLGQVKGEGFVLKLRQMAYGPATVGAFTVYSTTGPVVQAREVSNLTIGGNGHLWLTNFKI